MSHKLISRLLPDYLKKLGEEIGSFSLSSWAERRDDSSNVSISFAGQTNNGRLCVSLAERLLRVRAVLGGFQSEQIAQVS